ncbi:MAG TPA: hypothetical protein VFA10_14835 [Ktedonobacteraceae bacterium]|jgi:hypothetical protein|nr:hypothetical protein [Ktedonobacteraceae bacterium]
MMDMVLAVNPILAAWGQVAAIVICLYILIFVLIAVAFNLGMAFGVAWVREKVELLKMLRPYVDSVNKTSEAAVHGVPPVENENKIVQTVAEVPVRVHTIDKQVDQGTERVAKAVIEFRARTVQAQTIVKAFFLPGLLKRKTVSEVGEEGYEFKSPGYRILMEEKAPEVAVTPEEGGAFEQAVTSSQLKNAPPR